MSDSMLHKLRSKAYRRLWIVLLVLAVYALVGFTVAPRIVKTVVVDKLSLLTGQQVAIRELKINPLVLSATVRGFSVPDSSGERCLGFDELYVNFETSSIFHRAWTFSELTLIKPYVRLKIRKGGHVNLLDIVPATAPPAEADSAEGQGLPPIILSSLVIEQGEGVFEDDNRAVTFMAQLDSVGLALRDFTTLPRREGVYEFEASTNRGERLRWHGDVSVSPLRSDGHLELEGIKAGTIGSYLQDQLKFNVQSGELQLAADYTFDYSADSIAYRIHKGHLRVTDLQIADTTNQTVPLQLAVLELRDIEVDPQLQLMQIGLVKTERCSLQTEMDSLGNLSLVELLKPASSDTLRESPADSAQPWELDIHRIEISDYSVHFTDEAIEPTANWVIEPITLSVDSVRIGRPSRMTLLLQAGVNHAGSITCQGTVALDPLVADLAVSADSILLSDFQPYLNQFAKLTLKRGTLSSTGELHFAQQGSNNAVDFVGEVSVASLHTTDNLINQDFLRWTELKLKQLEYHTIPASLSIREIALQNPYIRYGLAADRSSNIEAIMIADSGADTTRSEASTLVTVGSVRVVNGVLNFSDFTLTPGFTISIESLNGTIEGLSSEQLARADVALQGKVDKYAPAEIQGQINPLSETAFTDITLSFHGIEMTTFTPYAGKYAGYRIDKGKLSLDLHYILSQHSLEATNHVVMDQLTLGERVEGPDVTKLPVKLVIALLKDRHGVIDLDIPLSGDLNDPDFKIMPLIMKIVVNMATKAVTAPFALLGGLFGKGEDLSYVSFLPGSDSLDATQLPKLESVARALTDRPELLLDIRGVASDAADRLSLAKSAVLTQLRGEDIGIDEKPLTSAEQTKVRDLFMAAFGTSPDSLVAPADAAVKKRDRAEYATFVAVAALDRLIAERAVPEDDLRELARRRASSVKGYLVLQGGIEDARLMLQDVRTDAEVTDGRISMPLALNAR